MLGTIASRFRHEMFLSIVAIIVVSVGCGEPTVEISQPVLSGTPVYRWKPPKPLARLKLGELTDDNDGQSFSGSADEDLLLYSKVPITGKFKVTVNGFRGIYLIGIKLTPKPTGILKVVNAKAQEKIVEGWGTLFSLQTHPDAINPFIFLAKIYVDTAVHGARFGDIFQVGGKVDGSPQATKNFPLVYVQDVLVPHGNDGWNDYWCYPKSMSQNVSHSDFLKFDTGVVLGLRVDRVDINWGYQTFYTTPSFAAEYMGTSLCNHIDLRPRFVPDAGSHIFSSTVMRLRPQADDLPLSTPEGIYFSRGSECIDGGEYYPHVFNEVPGSGVWISSAAAGSIANNVQPKGGVFAPRVQVDGSLKWPPSGYPSGKAPLAIGRIRNGSPTTAVITASEVGVAHRVFTRSALEDLAK